MKKIIFATAVAMISFFSCSKAELENTSNPLPMPENTAVSAQGLDVTPKTNYVVVGESVSLTATLKPEDAQAGTIAWKSSNEAVATVDANGHVTTLAVGVAHITASVDGVSASALVNVFAERVPATEIQLSKTEVSLLVGRAANIKSALLPENTTDARKLEWTSSDEKVAVVSYGYIQAVGMGEATITARQDDLTATVKVTVADKVKLVDRAEAWTVTDTPKWDKNWSGKITGSHEEVSVANFDGEYAYFGIVEASKFEGVEAVSNSVYEQVTEKQDAGQDPKGLFSTGESFSKNYSDMGNAVAYLLAYDSEFEFTGEYVVYNFEARTPDPVHATGIQFTQGWNNTPIESIELKEGKSMSYFGAQLLPEDCTDTGEISFKSSDESVVKITPYYSGYYTVNAIGAGEADIVATFNNIEASIHVTVTGGSVVWTDKSSEWSGSFGDVQQWGSTYFGFTLETCSSPKHYMFMAKASSISGDLVAYMKAQGSANADWLSYYAESTLPDSAYDWSGSKDDEYYAFVMGVDAAGSDFDGNYAIFHHDPNAGSGGDNPGGDNPGGDDPVDGKRIKFGDVVFRAELPSSRATSEEGTLEAWVYVTSTSGCQNIAGAESNFLLRIDGGQLDYVYGGTIDNRGEVAEAHVKASVSTNEWHHVVATYKQNGKAILYVDGEQKGSADTEDHPVYMDGKTKNDGSYPCWGYPFRFYIGSGSDKHNYSGSLAYLRVYDRVIGADEIEDLMYEEDVDDDSLIAYWKFNEGSGNTISDYSGYGLTLTAKQALTSGASGSEPSLSDGTITWEDGTLPF